MPMHGTSFKYSCPSEHISRWHLTECSPSILRAATFCIHANQAIAPQRHLTPNHFEFFGDEHICSLWVQPHCHKHLAWPKGSRVWLHISWWIHWNSSSAFYTSCISHIPIMAVQVTTFHDGILLNNLHFAYMSTSKLIPAMISQLPPIWMICSWTLPPSSSTTTLAHALSNLIKVT